MLLQGSDGNFYGTTLYGGTNGTGTVYRISPDGSETILHTFDAYADDGGNPAAGLVLGSDGNFYGTVSYGGTNLYDNQGTVFLISPNGSEATVCSFGSSPYDGINPNAGLVLGSDGNFYGTTYQGGTNSKGTVFRVSLNGNRTTLYSFGSYPHDGVTPSYAALVQGSDSNFYGTTLSGGTSNAGTIFRISPSGSYTNLYSFVGYPTDGGYPATGNGLVQGSDDSFYGTTSDGGTNGTGAVFKLTVPLNSPANRISAIKVAGANVLVTIPAIAGETYQLQDRTSLTAGAWADVAGQVISIGGLLTVTNFGGFSQPQQFYRFSIIP
jgi:uncharacterized repeat protein (TIGR03803 family)